MVPGDPAWGSSTLPPVSEALLRRPALEPRPVRHAAQCETTDRLSTADVPRESPASGFCGEGVAGGTAAPLDHDETARRRRKARTTMAPSLAGPSALSTARLSKSAALSRMHLGRIPPSCDRPMRYGRAIGPTDSGPAVIQSQAHQPPSDQSATDMLSVDSRFSERPLTNIWMIQTGQIQSTGSCQFGKFRGW